MGPPAPGGVVSTGHLLRDCGCEVNQPIRQQFRKPTWQVLSKSLEDAGLRAALGVLPAEPPPLALRAPAGRASAQRLRLSRSSCSFQGACWGISEVRRGEEAAWIRRRRLGVEPGGRSRWAPARLHAAATASLDAQRAQIVQQEPQGCWPLSQDEWFSASWLGWTPPEMGVEDARAREGVVAAVLLFSVFPFPSQSEQSAPASTAHFRSHKRREAENSSCDGARSFPTQGLNPSPSSCLPHLAISSTRTGHLALLRPPSWAPDPTAANPGALPSCRLLGDPRLASSPTPPAPPLEGASGTPQVLGGGRGGLQGPPRHGPLAQTHGRPCPLLPSCLGPRLALSHHPSLVLSLCPVSESRPGAHWPGPSALLQTVVFVGPVLVHPEGGQALRCAPPLGLRGKPRGREESWRGGLDAASGGRGLSPSLEVGVRFQGPALRNGALSTDPRPSPQQASAGPQVHSGNGPKHPSSWRGWGTLRPTGGCSALSALTAPPIPEPGCPQGPVYPQQSQDSHTLPSLPGPPPSPARPQDLSEPACHPATYRLPPASMGRGSLGSCPSPATPAPAGGSQVEMGPPFTQGSYIRRTGQAPHFSK
ncbi:formin-2-like [Phocoena sinus]|uniref:formin-2-like n=1 Tax=Phocoena sinus TaxID=42100 RepID=UPI0013C48C15|nr:formin-2-like [Phocoena sinus]